MFLKVLKSLLIKWNFVNLHSSSFMFSTSWTTVAFLIIFLVDFIDSFCQVQFDFFKWSVNKSSLHIIITPLSLKRAWTFLNTAKHSYVSPYMPLFCYTTYSFCYDPPSAATLSSVNIQNRYFCHRDLWEIILRSWWQKRRHETEIKDDGWLIEDERWMASNAMTALIWSKVAGFVFVLACILISNDTFSVMYANKT